MKPYGLPRTLDIESPDLVDIFNYGLKTSTGQLLSKGGDFRGSVKKKNRKIMRRFWKKRQRQKQKKEMKNDI